METIYLDTHVIVWLYYGLTENLSEEAKSQINENELLVSPMALLEIQYLFETKRISDTSGVIYEALSQDIGLKVCQISFEYVSKKAINQSFTKDPFDRIIVAQASCHNHVLLTKDRLIRDNYSLAIW